MDQSIIMFIVLGVYAVLALGFFLVNVSVVKEKSNTMEDGASKAIIIAAIGWSVIWPLAMIIGFAKSRGK